MGGGGSTRFFPSSEDINKDLSSIVRKEESENYKNALKDLLSEKLTVYNQRDVEGINTHMLEIKKKLERYIEGSIDIRFGGSVSKRTYVDGLSDIDSLVFLNKSELKDLSPSEVKDYFFSMLKERFPNTSITKGNLAVTLNFADSQIQLLPAIRCKGGIKIAKSDGESWSNIVNPSAFARELIVTNEKMNGKFIPVIKLIKAINSNLPEKRRLNGYHTEALALEIFKNYDGTKTHNDMIKHFYNKSQDLVKTPIREKTGQSRYVDEYLGGKNDYIRLAVSDSLSRIYRKINTADSSLMVDNWKDILY